MGLRSANAGVHSCSRAENSLLNATVFAPQACTHDQTSSIESYLLIFGELRLRIIHTASFASFKMFSIRAATAARRVPALRRQLVPTRTYATEQSGNPTVRPCASFHLSRLAKQCDQCVIFAFRGHVGISNHVVSVQCASTLTC